MLSSSVQAFLLQLHHRMNQVEGVLTETAPSSYPIETRNDIEEYLSTYFEEDYIPTGKSHSMEESILSQIKELELREKISMVPSPAQHESTTSEKFAHAILTLLFEEEWTLPSSVS